MPGFTQPAAFDLPDDLLRAIETRLMLLYGHGEGAATFIQLRERLARFVATHLQPSRERRRKLWLTAADAMLITYGDQIQAPGQPPLATLHDWLTTSLTGVITSVHILPFYPYSSDDGFSVIDYTAVDPRLGDWSDIERISQRFRLMFDAVINHVSAQSAWFQGFLRSDPRYADFFIVVDEPVDLSEVRRPRAHPLLTTFQTATGTHKVWTTFSADQIDLNYRNPAVLLAMIDVVLGYVARGASFLRLDAIGYLWKTIGTSCIHLPETHAMVQLMRSVLDAVAPHVLLITETNVPHAENISYFGDGYNEAQLVYQFPLAPLVLNAFQTGNARHLQDWARSLTIPSPATTFFNFLASHDGIGVMPTLGILSAEEIYALVQMTLQHGGRVSYKTNPDGTQSPYELNITLFDALSDPARTPEAIAIDRFMAAQAIMLALAGMPGIYVHSLVGSSNNLAGVLQTGHARTINRQKWQRADLDARLADPHSRDHLVFQRYAHLLHQRAASVAFDPVGGQQVIGGNDALLTLLRTAPDGSEAVFCIHNLAGTPQRIELQPRAWLDQRPSALHDLLSSNVMRLNTDGRGQLTLAPYEVVWLRAE
jgi:glycosidase